MPHFFSLGWDPKAQEAEYVGYLFPQPSLAPRVKYVTLTLPIKAPDLDSGTRTQESKGLGSSHSRSLAMSIVAKTISSNSWCRNSCTANCHFWWSEGEQPPSHGFAMRLCELSNILFFIILFLLSQVQIYHYILFQFFIRKSSKIQIYYACQISLLCKK